MAGRYRRLLMAGGTSRLLSVVLAGAICVGGADVGLLILRSSTGTAAVAATRPAPRSVRGAQPGPSGMASPPDPTVPGPAAPAPAQSPAPPSRGTPRVGPWRVGVTMAHFVDGSRPAPARAGGGPGRALDTLISYPIAGDPAAPPLDGGPPPATGQFPLVVFVHGFDVTPTTYAALTETWSRAGYIVASPAFPGEVGGEDGATQDDLPNEPADVRFVITSMMAPNAPVRSALDPTRIAVAGHSDGGEVAAGVGLDRCCADPRVNATIVMSGAELGVPGGGYSGVRHAPALIIESDGDEVNDPANAVQLYNDTPGQVWYLDLIGGRHLGPFLGTDPHWSIVGQVTTDFLNLNLKTGANLLNRFERDAIVPGLAKLYLKK
ncbi:MAG: hypothetical protein NVSMB12_02440 [Acidimicrobiales bacterium]